jgi:MoaA/NifB/PqqE/SkfB family radical SAM enzyme
MLPVLRAEGYDIVSLSGGEPLLYPGLDRIVDAAKANGFRIVAVSNGYPVRPKTRAPLRSLDGIAISFDGIDDVHNQIRGRKDAFKTGLSALATLRDLGRPVAAAYTVSKASLRDIPEFVETVIGYGVLAVQLRPLVMTGRALQSCEAVSLSSADLDRLFLIGESLREAYRGSLAIQTDLAFAPAIVADQGSYAAALSADPGSVRLADLVNPLVITPDGTLKPFTYDFPAPYDLGSINDLHCHGPQRLKGTRFEPFRALIGEAFSKLRTSHAFIDWFAYCKELAEETSAA